ncbi:MAG: CsbD family protein, partial [Nitrosomonas sp.]
WDQIEGNWKQLKGKAVEKWGEISDDEMDVIAGKKDQLVGKLQTKYGVTLEEAEKEVNDFSNDCKN